MKNPNVATLEKMYAAFAKGDFKTFLECCPENVTFQVQGKSKLAGKYTKSNFEKDFAEKLKTLSGGTFQVEVHDILASELHATILTTCKLKRDGKDHEYRSVHVWRLSAGQPIAWYEYPRDMYQYDAIWT